MGVVSKYNKKLFNYNFPEDCTYYNLKDLYKMEKENKLVVKYIGVNTKSRYGDAPMLATAKYVVNLPAHLLNTIKDMLKDDELITAINDDKVAFKIYQYVKDNDTYYSIIWIDLNDK